MGAGLLLLMVALSCAPARTPSNGARARAQDGSESTGNENGEAVEAERLFQSGDPLGRVPGPTVTRSPVSCSTELEPVSPQEFFPGVRGYPATVPRSKLVRLSQGGLVFAAPAFDGYVMEHGLLVAADGSRAVRLAPAYDRVFSRYEPMGIEQSWLVGFADAQDPCFDAGIHAFDPVTLEPRYQVETPPEWNGTTLRGVELGSQLLLFADGAEGTNLLALKTATGAVLWQGTAGTVWHDDTRLFVEMEQAIQALDPSNGAKKWRYTQGDGGVLSAHFGDRFGVLLEPCTDSAAGACADGRTVPSTVVRLSDGTVVRRARLPADSKLLASGDELFVARPVALHRRTALQLSSEDVRDGAIRWTLDPVPCSWDVREHYRIRWQVTERSLYLCSCDGVLREVDRSSGNVLSELSVGECHDFRVTPRGLLHSAFSYEAPEPETTKGTIFSPVWQSFEAFETPLRPLLVQGHVQFAESGVEASVRAGSQVFAIDSRGRFRAVVHGRGSLSLGVVFPPAAARATRSVIIPFDVTRPSVSDVELPTAGVR